MSRVSVLIPSRNELFLRQTVEDVLKSARGEVEVVVALDGYWPDPPLPDDPRLRIVHFSDKRGMRACINAAAGVARGDFLLKCDAHCSFAEGFDEVLKADCDGDSLVIARRYSLDAGKWERRDKEPVDYHYLDCPMTNPEYFQFHGVIWAERARARRDKPEYDLDETLSFQGSMWFMSRHHWDFLGGMSEQGYGTFSQEPQELGNKTWLSGGRVLVNKKTWYAHLHKGKQWGRMYSISQGEIRKGHEYSARYWMGNLWAERRHDMEWLIERFWPLPNWPEDWRERLYAWRQNAA